MFHGKLFWLLTLLTILAWVLAACGPAQAPSAGATDRQPTAVQKEDTDHKRGAEAAQLEPVSLVAGEKLRVVATTNIVADIVSRVGGDVIELTALIPLGADPHTYTATPQDVVAVSDAHVIFANGADLEADFLPGLIGQTQAPVIYLSQGMELRQLQAGPGHEGDDLDHGDVDPHTWTTPVNAIIFVRNIETALSALDPGHAQTYAANAQEYVKELTTLDEWVKQQIETIPPDNRKLVTDHMVFGYYADRYGLEQIGAIIPGFSTASEPSARELAKLEDAIREYKVPAIFVGTTVNPSLAEQVAQDTGVRLARLYTGSLGPEGSGVETYVDYIRYNTTAIVEGLR